MQKQFQTVIVERFMSEKDLAAFHREYCASRKFQTKFRAPTPEEIKYYRLWINNKISLAAAGRALNGDKQRGLPYGAFTRVAKHLSTAK